MKYQNLISERNDVLKQLEQMRLSRDSASEHLRQVQSECTDASNRLSESEEKYEQLRGRHEELEQERKNWISEKEMLLKEAQSVDVFKAEVSELKKDFMQKEKQWLSEKEFLTKEVSEVELLKDEISKLEEEVKVSLQIEKDYAVLKEEKNILNQKYSELNSQLETLSLEKEKLSDEVVRGKNETDKLNELLQQETKQKSAFMSECESLKEELEKASSRCSELSSQIENLTCEKSKLEDKGKKDKADIENLNKILQQEIKLKDDVLSECEHLKQDNNKANEEIARLNLCIENLEIEKKNQIHEKSSDWELQIEAITKEKMQIEEESKIRKEEMEKLERKCEGLKLEKDSVSDENSRLNMLIEESEAEKGNSEELKNIIALLEGRCRETKEAKDEYENKCIALNERLASLDKKLAEAHKLHLQFDATTNVNESLRKKLEETQADLNDCRIRLKDGELELKQLKEKYDNIEKDKVDVEVERDKLMEQYKMMNAELGSTMLALDREIQLTTHRRLSDIGSSIFRGFGDLATQTDEVPLFDGDNKKDKLEEKTCVPVPVMHASENRGVHQLVSDLQKENKDLHNKAEKLEMKLKEQNFTLKSLENKNSALRRRMQELEAEKHKFKEAQREYQNDMLDKLECERQLAELKLSRNMQEQSMREMERSVSVLVDSIKDNHDLGIEEDLSKTIRLLEVSFSDSQLQDTANSSHFVSLLDQSEEFDYLKRELNKALSKVLKDLDELDKVNQEKLEAELENIALRARLSQLESEKTCERTKSTNFDGFDNSEHREENSQDVKNLVSLEKELQTRSVQVGSEHFALEKELQTFKMENLRLQRNIERQEAVFDLERQHLQSPKLKIQVSLILAPDRREDASNFYGHCYNKEIVY